MNLRDIQVKVGVISYDIYDEYKFCDTPAKKLAFLEWHSGNGTLVYENLDAFRSSLNNGYIDPSGNYIDFIPSSGLA